MHLQALCLLSLAPATCTAKELAHLHIRVSKHSASGNSGSRSSGLGYPLCLPQSGACTPPTLSGSAALAGRSVRQCSIGQRRVRSFSFSQNTSVAAPSVSYPPPPFNGFSVYGYLSKTKGVSGGDRILSGVSPARPLAPDLAGTPCNNAGGDYRAHTTFCGCTYRPGSAGSE